MCSVCFGLLLCALYNMGGAVGGGVMWGVMKCYVICQLHTALYDIDSGSIQFYFGEVSGRLKIDINTLKIKSNGRRLSLT